MSSLETTEVPDPPLPSAKLTQEPEVWANRNVILLWLGHLISSLGDWALWIAIPITVYRRTNSTVDLSFTLVTEGIPLLLISPFAGVMVDRWDRRRTMIAADIGRAIMVCALLLPAGHVPLWLYYIVLFVCSGLSAFFSPARAAFLMQIVSRQQYMRTNALLATSMQISEFIGPAVGGFIFTVLSQRGSFICDAASFLFSAVCIALVSGVPRLTLSKPAEGGVIGVLADIKEGLVFIGRTPVVRGMVVMGPLIYIISTIFNAPEYAFASKYLHATAKQYGLLLSSAGFGVFVGGIAILAALHKAKPLPLLVTGLVIATFGGVGYGLSTNYIWALTPHFFLGFGLILASIPLATLIQNNLPAEMVGRVFGTLSIFTRGGQVVSGIAAGFLASAIPIPKLYVGNSLLLLVLAALAFLFCRSEPNDTAPHR